MMVVVGIVHTVCANLKLNTKPNIEYKILKCLLQLYRSEKMAYNPKDFFWGKIDENILPVVPYGK